MTEAIQQIKKQIDMGVIQLKPDGTFWKLGKLTSSHKIIPIKPRRLEVRLSNGYFGVAVWMDGKQYLATAHRVVWTLLVGDIPNGMDINHKDGNKHNNDPVNLEVVTRSENLYHAYRTGLKTKRNYAREISVTAKNLRRNGLSYSQIATKMKISTTTAFRAVNM